MKATKPTPLDPLRVNERLYRQVARLLDDIEDADNRAEITIRERIAALVAVGRLQVLFGSLGAKANADESDAGGKVRKYSSAFKTNAAPRRAAERGGNTSPNFPYDDDEDSEP